MSKTRRAATKSGSDDVAFRAGRTARIAKVAIDAGLYRFLSRARANGVDSDAAEEAFVRGWNYEDAMRGDA